MACPRSLTQVQCLPQGYQYTSWFIEFETIGPEFKEEIANSAFQSRLLFSIKRDLFQAYSHVTFESRSAHNEYLYIDIYGENLDKAETISDLKQNQ